MRQELNLPDRLAGDIFQYRYANLFRASHRHTELEFNLVAGGTATYLLGDRRYDLSRNMLVWLFPEQEHVLLGESADFVAWIGVFKPLLTAHTCTGPEARTLRAANPPGHHCRKLPPDAADRLRHLLPEVARAREDVPRFNAGLGYALLTAWACHRAADDTAPGTDIHPAVERAVSLLVAHPDVEGVTQIARDAGLSESRLQALFKRQTGVTLTQFRSRQRVKRFLSLYGAGNRISMSRAASEAGFGSYTQFHRVFKSVMGCGPVEYRRDARRAEAAEAP